MGRTPLIDFVLGASLGYLYFLAHAPYGGIMTIANLFFARAQPM